MLEDGAVVLEQMERFVSAENAQAFGDILQNTNTLTAKLNQSLATLEPTLKALPTLVDQLEGTLANVNKMGGEVSALTQSAQQTIDLLNSPSGPLQQATASLKQLQRSAAQLQASTLPQIEQMIDAISQASRTFSRTADQFEQTPQSLIFGAPPVRPGPGEPGFNGFKDGDQQ